LVKQKSYFWLLGLICLVGAIAVFYWAGKSNIETDVIIPIEVSQLPREYIITSPPLKALEVRVVGDESTINTLSDQQPTYTLNLSRVEPGLLTLPISMKQLPIPDDILVVYINPTSVTFRIETRMTKTVWVDVAISGNAAAGYQVAGTEAFPPKISLSGPEKRLNKLDRISTQPVALNDATESFKTEIALDLPENIGIVSGSGLIAAAIQIEERITIRKFLQIPVVGIQTTYVHHITPEYIDLSVSGSEKTLAQLSSKTDIHVSVDLKNLKPGVYARQAEIQLPIGTTLVGAKPEVFTVAIDSNKRKDP